MRTGAVVIALIGSGALADSSACALAQEPPPAPVDSRSTLDLQSALTLGDLTALKSLLNNGADPNGLSDGMPVWLSALLMGQKEMFLAMSGRITVAVSPPGSRVQIGADALATAAARGYTDVVRLLLRRGVDVNARQSVGTTALHIAAANNREDIVKSLVSLGADVNVADQHGDTPLMAAVRTGNLRTVDALLRANARPDTQDRDGRTAVWWAARTDREVVLKALLRGGADVNLADRKGGTPLMLAVRMGRPAMANILRKHGAAGNPPPHRPGSLSSALQASIPLIQTRAVLWTEKTKCGSCHHTWPGLLATSLARESGIKIDDTLATKQYDYLRRSLIRRAKQAAPGAISREASAGNNGPSPQQDRSFSLALDLALVPALGADLGSQVHTLAALLANLQFEDGRWIHGLARFPIESSDVLTTAYAIRGLQRYASPLSRDRMLQSIQHAGEWLKHTTPGNTMDAIGRLYGLYWLGGRAAELRQAGLELIRQQETDGSWAQMRGMTGDAYATGLAAMALHETGQLRVADKPFERAVTFLLQTQEDDGSWLVPTRAIPLNGYLESGSPHGKHQFISYAGTCWAAMTLMTAQATQTAYIADRHE